MARFAPTQSRPDEFRAVHRVADRAFPNLRDALVAAFERARQQMPVERIEEALSVGRFDDVAAVVDSELLAATVGRIAKQTAQEDETATIRVLSAILVGAARGSADDVPDEVEDAAVQLAARLNVSNPRAVERARKLAGTMLTRVSRESREAIRAIIAGALRDGTDVPTTAALVRDTIGLDSRSARALRNYRSTLDEALAEGRTADLRRRFRLAPARLPAGTRDRLGGQVTPSQRREVMVDGYRQRLLRHRATTIARSESIRASNAGQHMLWDEMMRDGLIDPSRARRVWIAAADDRVCPICLPLNGKTIEFLGDWVSDTLQGPGQQPQARPQTVVIGRWPPAHVMCRCSQALRFA